MKKLALLFVALIIGVILYGVSLRANAPGDNQAEIKALEQRFAAAFNAKDVNGIMAVYLPDESLHVFDAMPPREYVGAKAYRKDWEDFFAAFSGPVQFDISDLSITAEGNLAFSHSIQHVRATGKDGEKADITVRVTDAYRKINGKWLIVHEHVSVPVDLATGKADLSSKP